MRWILLLGLALAACSKGPEADLPSIGQARSLAAEWALVNEQASEGRINQTYVGAMRGWIRENLQTTSRSLTEPDSQYGGEIRATLAEPDDAAPDRLRAHANALKRIEDSLESA